MDKKRNKLVAIGAGAFLVLYLIAHQFLVGAIASETERVRAGDVPGGNLERLAAELKKQTTPQRGKEYLEIEQLANRLAVERQELKRGLEETRNLAFPLKQPFAMPSSGDPALYFVHRLSEVRKKISEKGGTRFPADDAGWGYTTQVASRDLVELRLWRLAVIERLAESCQRTGVDEVLKLAHPPQTYHGFPELDKHLAEVSVWVEILTSEASFLRFLQDLQGREAPLMLRWVKVEGPVKDQLEVFKATILVGALFPQKGPLPEEAAKATGRTSNWMDL